MTNRLWIDVGVMEPADFPKCRKTKPKLRHYVDIAGGAGLVEIGSGSTRRRALASAIKRMERLLAELKGVE